MDDSDAYHTPPAGVYSSPVLPPGWVWAFSTDADDCYYIHQESNSTQWEHPDPANELFFLQWLGDQLRIDDEFATGGRGLSHGFGRPEKPANGGHWWQKRFSDLAVGDFHYRPPPPPPRPNYVSSVRPGRPWHMMFSKPEIISTDLAKPPPLTPFPYSAPPSQASTNSSGYPASMFAPAPHTSPHLSPRPQQAYQSVLPPVQYAPATPPPYSAQQQTYPSRPQQAYPSPPRRPQQPYSTSPRPQQACPTSPQRPPLPSRPQQAYPPSPPQQPSYSNSYQSDATVASRPSLSYSIETGSSCDPVTPVSVNNPPFVAFPNPDKYRPVLSPTLSQGQNPW